MDQPKVYIIVANYQTWADTIACLESVLRNDYPNYQIIVHDDASPNNAMEYLLSWAAGKLSLYPQPGDALQSRFFPGVPKPIPYLVYSRQEALSGGDAAAAREMAQHCRTGRQPVIFIRSERNLGFAGSNNICLAYALQQQDFAYAWLLNNDTVIDREALVHLVARAREYESNQQKVGIIGTKLLYYHQPRTIQGVGGRYKRMLATTEHLGRFEADAGQYDVPDLEMDYVIGASMLVSKPFLEEVGLLATDYFLYFEDIAWGFSARAKGWGLGYAYKSRVYHKEGATAGANVVPSAKSILSEYYSLKNRLVFTKKFFPQYLWAVYLGFIAVIFNRIRRRQFDRVKLVLDILLHPDKPLDLSKIDRPFR